MPVFGVVGSFWISDSHPTHWVSLSGSLSHAKTSSGGRLMSTLPRMRPASRRFDAIHSPAALITSTRPSTPAMRTTHFIMSCERPTA